MQRLNVFSDQIRAARKAKALSQVEAAEKLKIDYRHYQNIEGAKINLRFDTFLKLIDFYEIKPDLQKEVGPF